MKPYSLCTLVALLALLTSQAFGQSDSVRTEYQTEDATISRSEIQRVIRYITRANIEEKTLLKFGLLPNSASYTQQGYVNTIGFTTELGVERKLSPSFSLLLGVENQITANHVPRNAYYRLSASPGQDPIWLPVRSFSIQLSAKAAVRYYYNMARRIREGRSANNFSGTYIGFQTRRPVFASIHSRQREFISGEYRTDKQLILPRSFNTMSFGLQWGIQQRLGRRGYIDLNAGPELSIFNMNQSYYTSKTQLSFRINAVVGLGW